MAGEAVGGGLRLAESADLERIMEIRLGVRENRLRDPSSVTLEMCRSFMVHDGAFWVHELDGGITGFSAADRRDGTIWALFVEQRFTGRGIGRALLRQACWTLREAGFSAAELTTDAGTYAEGFYRGEGWREISRSRDGELRFQKTLIG